MSTVIGDGRFPVSRSRRSNRRTGTARAFVRNCDGSLGNGLKLYVTDDPGIEIVR